MIIINVYILNGSKATAVSPNDLAFCVFLPYVKCYFLVKKHYIRIDILDDILKHN